MRHRVGSLSAQIGCGVEFIVRACVRVCVPRCGRNHLTNVYFYNLSVAELDEAKQHCRAINMTGNLVEDEVRCCSRIARFALKVFF